MKRVLISVYNKAGIITFAKELSKFGFEIIATSGTFHNLKKENIPSIKLVSDVIRFPEILAGRVKTQHPKLMGAILALRNKEEHIKDLKFFGIKPISMVVCNLYPFELVSTKKSDLKTVLENIDIGGPNLIRAAAKNFENIIVITNPKRYQQILKEYKENGEISFKTRKKLALEAFEKIADYDSKILEFFKRI